MKRRLIETVQSVFVTAGMTAAELLLMGLARMVSPVVPAPVLWLAHLNFGGTAGFILLIFFVGKQEMRLPEKLVLMLFPLLISAVNVSLLFPLASTWWIGLLLELLGAVFGVAFAACLQVSGEQSQREERYGRMADS